VSLVALGASVVLLVVGPLAVDRWAAPWAAPRRVIVLAMVRLAGLALAPLALVACAGQLLAEGVGGWWHAGVVTVAVVFAALTLGRACRAVYLAERRWREVGAALSAVGGSSHGPARVVPLAGPTAFTAGDRVVVSSLLVETLESPELDAVIAHESAHLRGGHPRIAAWAHALRLGAFNLAPARAAEARVRQQLELLADQEAAGALGDSAPVRAAVSKLSALALPGGEFIAERLDCLELAPQPAEPANRLVAAATGVAAAGAVVVVCGALHVRLAGVGLGVCGVAGAGLIWVLLPLRRSRRQREGPTRRLFT